MQSHSELLNSTLRTGSNFCVTLGKPQFYIYNTKIIFHFLPPNTLLKRLKLLIFYSNNRKCVMIMHDKLAQHSQLHNWDVLFYLIFLCIIWQKNSSILPQLQVLYQSAKLYLLH